MDLKIEIDEDLTKDVKTRKPHDCITCGKMIPKGMDARALSYRTDKGRKLYKVYQHAACAQATDKENLIKKISTQE